MSIFRPKLNEKSLLVFSCAELPLVGVLSSMAVVHLLMRARWWGQLVPLGWTVAVGEENSFILSQ